MIPLDPVTLGVIAAGALMLRKKGGPQFGALTEEREEVYRNALEYLKDSDKLIALSDAFYKQGLKVEALILKERAKWRARSPETKEQHTQIYAKAMTSVNPEAILKVAAVFETMTATKRAATLRARAKELREKASNLLTADAAPSDE